MIALLLDMILFGDIEKFLIVMLNDEYKYTIIVKKS